MACLTTTPILVLVIGGLVFLVYRHWESVQSRFQSTKDRVLGQIHEQEPEKESINISGQRHAPSQDGRSAGSTGLPRARTALDLSETVKAVCPCCTGEGYYMQNPKNRKPCPVCRGKGHRMLKITPRHKICPDCKGIGWVEDKARHPPDRVPRSLRRRAHRCGRCAGKGRVKGR